MPKGIPADIVTRVSGPPRHRALAHHRPHGAVPLLPRRHQGEVGDAPQHPARFQDRLRPERAARRGIAQHRGGRAGPVRGDGAQGSRRRDVGPHAEEPPGALAGAGLRHAAQAGDDAAARLPEADGGDGGEGAPRQDGQSRRRGRRDSLSARHPDRHAGGEHRRAPMGRGSPTCDAARSTGSASPGSRKKSKAQKSTTGSTTSTA